MKIKQTINFAHSLQNSEKTNWICVALPLIQKPPPPLPLQPQCSPQLLLKQNENIRKKCIASQTGHKPNCFFPSVEYHQNTGEIVFPINCNDRLLEKTLVYKEKKISKFVIAMNDNYQNVGNCTMILT